MGVWLDRICLADAVAEPVNAAGPISHNLRKGPQTLVEGFDISRFRLFSKQGSS